jgi:hydrogenase expression/formation protein HypD
LKFVDEYRDGGAAHGLAEAIDREATRPWVIMEVCGGQTHSIVRHGIDEMLPLGVELVHGPGCPVCVTPLEMIDKAHAIAGQRGVVFCSFGDMLRVPGSHGDLLGRKAEGCDVRVVYSPLDAVDIAAKNPDRRVVFFAIGFETTAPANAMALRVARQRGLRNFSALVSHVLVPPAIEAILNGEGNRVQAFLGPGHVCAIMGTGEYEPIARRHRVPIVVTGFEPIDILQGVLLAVRQLERGDATVHVQYGRAVRAPGNLPAQRVISEVFEVCDRAWRGVGVIPASGLRLRDEYREHDAAEIFDVASLTVHEPEACISGEILMGKKRPRDCSAFGGACTPVSPLGATMVSSEGACAAYFAYGRHLPATDRRRLPIADGRSP